MRPERRRLTTGMAPQQNDVERADELPISPLARISFSDMKDSDVQDVEMDKLSTYGARLLLYAQNQRDTQEVAPWFPEFGILHRMNIIDINNRLASCKRTILESGEALEIETLRNLLAEQATAIRNYEYIQSLDYMPAPAQIEHQREVEKYFPDVRQKSEKAYRAENYRSLTERTPPYEHGDPLRHLLCSYLPVSFSYSPKERKQRGTNYKRNIRPRDVSIQVGVVARFLIAMFGACFILVPTYIMSFDSSRTKNLVVTSVAVVLFACCCSVGLRTANDQTLGNTAGYAAVLMVFVGLTASNTNT